MKVAEDVVPFVFLILGVLVSLGVGAAKLGCRGTKIHYKNTLIGLLSMVALGNWMFLLYLTVKSSNWQSAVILSFALSCSYILNLLFFCLYVKVMREDAYYEHWRQGRSKSECVLVTLALLTTFQLYRIVFQKLS